MKKKCLFILCLLCYSVLLHAKKIYVRTEEELTQANNAAIPGDTIVLTAGVWNNIELQLTCHGSAEKPILFTAAQPGNVIISGQSSLKISGSYIVVNGLVFANGFSGKENTWEFKGEKQVANNCRITNCVINSFNNTNRLEENNWVTFYGKNNRIDYCSFLNKTNGGVLVAVILNDERSLENYHIIENNYFGIRKPLGNNGGEMIRIGVAQHAHLNSNTIIRNNLFEDCDGETEIISIKSAENRVVNNVFKECQGAVVLRHGNNNTIAGNLFWGNNKEGTGGVRIINEGNWVVNNLFINCAGVGFRSALTLMNGVPNSPPTRYVGVRDAVIANNTFVNYRSLSLGEGKDAERSVPPRNVFVFNNVFSGKETKNLFNIYDNIDSVFFSSNFATPSYTLLQNKGIAHRKFMSKRWGNTTIPLPVLGNLPVHLPAHIASVTRQRLQFDLPATAGCIEPLSFIKLFDRSKKTGATYFQKSGGTSIKSAKSYLCPTASDVYKKLALNDRSTVIVLTGNAYTFNEPIVIKNTVTFRSMNKNIVFKSSVPLYSLFLLKENASLKLQNLRLTLNSLRTQYFINSDSAGNTIHYSIFINNCNFYELKAQSFVDAVKNTYADRIVIKKSGFFNCSSNLISLRSQTEDKGYYNAEDIVVDSCTIKNNNGYLLYVYRGGKDESTLGPKVYFNHNSISNCNATVELIQLYGTRITTLANNRFVNCNTGNVLLQYIDKVAAIHRRQNNILQNSGTIIENEFVTNIK